MNSNFDGRVYETNNFGKFKIIHECVPIGYRKGTRVFLIEFLNTGYRMVATYDAIRHKAVKDKYVPNVAGVGYIGDLTVNISYPSVFFLYKPWNDMINRCYNQNNKSYRYYGGAGVTVDIRWHNFTNFFADAKFLPNFEKKRMYPTLYELDKDYLQFGLPKNKKVYSKDTCMWLSFYDNNMIMNRENSNGYYGVIYRDHRYHTRINEFTYGSFDCPEAAANLFNYVYPQIRNAFNDIILLNDVDAIPFEELDKYGELFVQRLPGTDQIVLK